mmetsp:Transcript_39945/g.127753  ORF Transcript_39945/g.127753 Transcript_39945/m.127753 type:complete len:813 (-) Transcript_39945:123-2561(-)
MSTTVEQARPHPSEGGDEDLVSEEEQARGPMGSFLLASQEVAYKAWFNCNSSFGWGTDRDWLILQAIPGPILFVRHLLPLSSTVSGIIAAGFICDTLALFMCWFLKRSWYITNRETLLLLRNCMRASVTAVTGTSWIISCACYPTEHPLYVFLGFVYQPIVMHLGLRVRMKELVKVQLVPLVVMPVSYVVMNHPAEAMVPFLILYVFHCILVRGVFICGTSHHLETKSRTAFVGMQRRCRARELEESRRRSDSPEGPQAVLSMLPPGAGTWVRAQRGLRGSRGTYRRNSGSQCSTLVHMMHLHGGTHSEWERERLVQSTLRSLEEVVPASLLSTAQLVGGDTQLLMITRGGEDAALRRAATRRRTSSGGADTDTAAVRTLTGLLPDEATSKARVITGHLGDLDRPVAFEASAREDGGMDIVPRQVTAQATVRLVFPMFLQASMPAALRLAVELDPGDRVVCMNNGKLLKMETRLPGGYVEVGVLPEAPGSLEIVILRSPPSGGKPEAVSEVATVLVVGTAATLEELAMGTHKAAELAIDGGDRAHPGDAEGAWMDLYYRISRPFVLDAAAVLAARACGPPPGHTPAQVSDWKSRWADTATAVAEHACKNGWVGFLENVLDAFDDLGIKVPGRILHWAIKYEHMAIARMLLRKYNVEFVSAPEGGASPLHVAVWNNATNLVRLLLASTQAPANCTAHDTIGRAALQYATDLGYTYLADLIRQRARELGVWSPMLEYMPPRPQPTAEELVMSTSEQNAGGDVVGFTKINKLFMISFAVLSIVLTFRGITSGRINAENLTHICESPLNMHVGSRF